MKKTKHKLTLYFDSKQGVSNFRAWYIDSGGEQSSNYFSEDRGDDWLYLKPPKEACPKCEYYEGDILDALYEQKTKKVIEYQCVNCNHNYKIENCYYEKRS